MTDFSEEQVERYSRHIILPEVGGKGQRKLLESRVFVLGAGGLGSPSLLYLAAAGVGTIGIADNDKVELTNLQRQIIHDNERVGMEKTLSAKETIGKLNPDVNVILHGGRVTTENVRGIIRGYDLVLDGSDNFPTRFLINDAAYFEKKPLISGSMFRFEGQVAVFMPHDGSPCYRCLYGEPPPPALAPNCSEAGVLGALPGVIGVLQAIEAIKLILGIGTSLTGHLLVFDALGMNFRKMKTRKDPACALCGETPTIKKLIAYEESCGLNAPSGGVGRISAAELSEKISSGSPPILLDVRETDELTGPLGHLEGVVHVPLASLERRAAELRQDREVTVICRLGQRAATGAGILLKKGFSNVSVLEGGMTAWRKEFK